MSKKDEVKENVEMYRGFIFINLGCMIGIIAFIFGNFDKLYTLDTKAIFMLFCCFSGIVILAFALRYCAKKYKSNLTQLRDL